MGASYNYKTGAITRDFSFVRAGEACYLAYSVGARVGYPVCERCQYYGGVETEWDRYEGVRGFVICRHPDSKDSECAGGIIHQFHERLIEEALSAL